MNQDLSDTEDYEATSEILSGSTVFEDTSESIAYASTKVLPPIERSEIAVQTDITLVSGSNVSSFRPEQLTQEIPPYPPLPIIATTSAPALLKGVEETAENRTSDEEDGSKVSVNDLHTQINNINNDSADQLQTMDEDAQSDVPTQPSEGGSNSTYTSISELDGVGPPTILQYIKESTKVKRNVPAPRPLLDRFPTVDPGCERGNMCPFCHTELLPVPPLSDASDDETETPTPNDMRKPGSPPYTIKDTERGTPGLAKAGAQSVFSVKSPPPMFGLPEDNDDDKLRSDGYLYCCEDYYWHLVNKNRIERRDSFYQEGEVMEVKKIDVSPHAPFGSKAARKLAKDRATERVRERELDKVRPPGGPPRAGGGGGGGATTLFSYARQMKTINFALSSRKCLEDGWTVTNYVPPPETPEPVLYDSMDTTQFHPLPGLAIPWQQTSSEFNKGYEAMVTDHIATVSEVSLKAVSL